MSSKDKWIIACIVGMFILGLVIAGYVLDIGASRDMMNDAVGQFSR